MLHPNYPTAAAVDDWCRTILDASAQLALSVQSVEESPFYRFPLHVRHQDNARFLAFTCSNGDTFYGYWQPSQRAAPAPLLIHLPGYGAEMSAHPQLVAQGYHVLHINPLGYTTPEGFNEVLRGTGAWPVLPDTITTHGARGYRQWLTQALAAVQWACAQPAVQAERLGVFGTSQGGGGALLLGSLLAGHGVKAVAADLPFLTNFPLVYTMSNHGAYEIAFTALDGLAPEQRPDAWRALGYIDTLSHAHRLTMPVMLTAGAIDETTPKNSILSLFDRLPATRGFTEFAGQAHAYTVPFLSLATAWFHLYV